MLSRKKLIILFFVLLFIFSSCNSAGIQHNQDPEMTRIAVEQNSTAFAVSGLLKTPSFVLNTPLAAIATPSPTNAPIIAPNAKLAVVMIEEGEELNVFTNPGESQEIVTTIPAHATDITQTGKTQELDDELWLEIHTGENIRGWIKAENVTQQISSTRFCSDSKIRELVTQFMSAIQSRDGVKLAQTINPRRGLIIHHEWWNPKVQFKGQDVLENLFTETTSKDWGIQDGNGLAISGAFKDEILPKLDDIQTGTILTCNNLDYGLASGGSAGYIRWPFEYTNFNFMSIYRAAPEGDELNWRTWALGVEYINGNPSITILVQYHWEN
ncbi:MAG: hypothetical protein JW908_01040 [Anaerolineales bacterium]|nr:hypothetical protein [Anaerolineales bacterium]